MNHSRTITKRLHDSFDSGNGYKVRLILTQLALPYERIEYDTNRGEKRTPLIPTHQSEWTNSGARAGGRSVPLGIKPILFYPDDGTRFLAKSSVPGCFWS